MENKRFKRILIIDDDEFIVSLLTLLLNKEGYQIVSAGDGKEAIRILTDQQVDLIILDLMMPEMDGLVFLNTLMKEATAATPILILTAMVSAETEREVKDAGAMALLYKPIKVPELLAKIRQLENSIQ